MRFLSILLATLAAAKLHNRILTVLVLTISTFVTAAADCSSNFCESVLKDGFLTLRYKLNEPDDTITMEVTYEGDAWVGLAFSDASEYGWQYCSDCFIRSETSEISIDRTYIPC